VGSGKNKVEMEWCEEEREFKRVYIEGNGWALGSGKNKVELEWCEEEREWKRGPPPVSVHLYCG
jgi:hypothetical protein